MKPHQIDRGDRSAERQERRGRDRRRQWDVESRGARRWRRRIERSYENRRSRKGAYDMRMRRSTRKTGALILDLVTLTPAGVSLPAYYTRFTHTPAPDERSAKHAPRSAAPSCPARRGALHIRRDCTSRSCSLTHGRETREKWMLTRLLHASPYPRRAYERDRTSWSPRSSPYVHQRYLRLVPTGSRNV